MAINMFNVPLSRWAVSLCFSSFEAGIANAICSSKWRKMSIFTKHTTSLKYNFCISKPSTILYYQFKWHLFWSEICTKASKYTSLVAQVGKLSHLKVHQLDVLSRYRNPQFQVGKNCTHLYNNYLWPNICKSWSVNTHFIPNNCDLAF